MAVPSENELKHALLIAILAAVIAGGNYGVRKLWFSEDDIPVQVVDVDVNALGDFISGEELYSLIRARKEILILDVRDDFFFGRGHISQALNFDHTEFDKNYPIFIETIKSAPRVIVYCNDTTCDNSKVVAARLRSLGHKHISVYSGGWEEWKRHFDKQYFPNP